MSDILISLILLTPVTITAIVQMVIVKKNLFSSLAKPIDGRKEILGNYILGETKTWRGVIFMLICTPIVSVAFYPLFPMFCNISCSPLLNFQFGILTGLGYSLGEFPNSFIKRRCSIPSGEVPETVFWRSIVVFADSFDSSFGATILVLLSGLFIGGVNIIIYAFIIGGVIHISVNFILWEMNVKKYWT
ncbi:MAG: CDP-archaeol synthase [Candidatus Heimdallarchaeota archaeon]|nr:CDP-archaeol synthase [Candidatus Heimdallarchaeota archaeon]MDH5647627.1 CDP-archaeol synthase [Candidatus Heimdallarchaeota archaeon]